MNETAPVTISPNIPPRDSASIMVCAMSPAMAKASQRRHQTVSARPKKKARPAPQTMAMETQLLSMPPKPYSWIQLLPLR